MSRLRESLAEYLAVRRALGYRLERAEKLLSQFLDHLEATGAEQITVAGAVEWATLPARSGHWHAMRLQAARGFARYLHEVDPQVEVPAAELLPDRPHRATPYLYAEQQILALMRAAGTLRTSHRAATFRTLFGLLAVTGLRIGEAIALDRSDFDADRGVLVVRHGKFGKSRELPLHPTTTSAVARYLRRRDRPRPAAPTDALLVSSAGTRLLVTNVQTTFRTLRARAQRADNLPDAASPRRPRGEVSVGRKDAHVGADLGDDDLRGAGLHAGDRAQQPHRVIERVRLSQKDGLCRLCGVARLVNA